MSGKIRFTPEEKEQAVIDYLFEKHRGQDFSKIDIVSPDKLSNA